MMNFQPWRWLSPQLAHDLAPIGLKAWARFCGLEQTPEWKPFSWKDLHFKNRLGIAGGVDKNSALLPVWQRLGFGFCEVGTVTPLPQKPNPGKIIDRNWSAQILWNKMGFPSEGAEAVLAKLTADREQFLGPVFVNIGKNRATPVERAVDDYSLCASVFAPVADALVVNVSSPNTQGLRSLQIGQSLRPLLESVIEEAGGTPVLVKLSPDSSKDELGDTITAAVEAKVSGFILTNTTSSRPEKHNFALDGGLSGKFLAERSTQAMKTAISVLGQDRSQFLLVSAGGILSPDQVKERLDLGADLVQVYSALVFHGPSFPNQVAKELRS